MKKIILTILILGLASLLFAAGETTIISPETSGVFKSMNVDTPLGSGSAQGSVSVTGPSVTQNRDGSISYTKPSYTYNYDSNFKRKKGAFGSANGMEFVSPGNSHYYNGSEAYNKSSKNSSYYNGSMKYSRPETKNVYGGKKPSKSSMDYKSPKSLVKGSGDYKYKKSQSKGTYSYKKVKGSKPYKPMNK